MSTEPIDTDAIATAVGTAVSESMPYPSLILDAISSGVAARIWTPLPAGAHLRLGDEVMTDRGAVVRLTDDVRLKVGR